MGKRMIAFRLAATLPNHKVQFANMRIEIEMQEEIDLDELDVLQVAKDELSESVWKMFREECKAAREIMDK